MEEERNLLIELVSKGNRAAATIKRANILLAVDRGEFAELKMTDEQAAKAYHATTRTITTLKKTFVEEGFDKALDRKKRDKPPKITIDGQTEAKIVALTCQSPPEGYAAWSLRLIADTVVELGILPSISHVAIGDLLKKTNLSHGYTKSGAYLSSQASS
jgi:transposase